MKYDGSIKDASPQLQERYPELVALLNDLDGFHKFVLNRLRMFNLVGRYSPDDVINECLLRWYKAVESGKSVPVIAGWMRLTAQNIIHELSRDSQKASLYEPDVLTELVSETLDETDTEAVDEQQQMVRRALAALPEQKRELLELRFFQNLSWDQVAALYASRGKKVSASTYRKRGERALKELRKVFLEMLRA